MHLTKQASAYMENVWLWTADQYGFSPLLSLILSLLEMTLKLIGYLISPTVTLTILRLPTI